MAPNPEKRKSDPASRIGSVCAVRRMSEDDMRVSLPVQDSRSYIITQRFSAITSRIPSGTDAVTLTPSMPPFWTPWAPAARVTAMQRASRYSIDLPSEAPISTSAPEPDVKRILRPRDA